MKKNFSLYFLMLFITNFSLAQTDSEKQQIKATYNLEKVSALQKTLQEEQMERSARISQYLAQNPTMSRVNQINDKKYVIYDIYDGEPVYITTDNVDSASATRTNFLNPGGSLGLNLEGENMTIGVWDGGQALDTHVEFAGVGIGAPSRITLGDDFTAGSYSDHATHVSGTLAAQGIDSDAKGMAPKANIISYNFTDAALEASFVIAQEALLISNHSYGFPVFDIDGNLIQPTWRMGCYDNTAVSWDNIANTFPYHLMVKSAGNEGFFDYTPNSVPGFDKLTGASNSKNNLVVANGSNPGISASGDLLNLTINSSSSEGPSDDGRIKPDITGDGTDVFSPVGATSSSYSTYNGTSMSSPNVAGTLLLLQEYYNDLHSQYMKAATLKGLVCHTADDDTTYPGPDPVFGWGLLNAKVAAETILDASNNSARLSELTLADGETFSTPITSAGTGPLSITICWTDPVGPSQDGLEDSTTSVLVNDLDILLRHPNNFLLYQPWKLFRNNLAAGAVTGNNSVDTVEKIDLEAPIAGTYTLEVSHKGTLVNPQDYSLIITGTGLTLSTDNIDITEFNVWPNPTERELNFTYNSVNGNTSSVTLVDMQGRVVYSNEVKPLGQFVTGKINTSNFSSGIYTLTINEDNAKVHKKVIIK